MSLQFVGVTHTLSLVLGAYLGRPLLGYRRMYLIYQRLLKLLDLKTDDDLKETDMHREVRKKRKKEKERDKRDVSSR